MDGDGEVTFPNVVSISILGSRTTIVAVAVV
jgi:hypothetical protein